MELGDSGRSKMVVWGQEVKEGGRRTLICTVALGSTVFPPQPQLGPVRTEGARRPLAQQDSGQAHKCVHAAVSLPNQRREETRRGLLERAHVFKMVTLSTWAHVFPGESPEKQSKEWK